LFDENSKCIADQGGWAEAMDYLVALQDAGATFTGDYGQAEGPFRAGETPYFVNGPWALADYKKDLGDKLGVAVLPVGPGGDAANPFNGIDGFYINPNTQNMEGALALALFLSSGDSAQTYTDSAGHVPIRDSVSSSDPLVATFAQASASGFPRPQTAEFANYWTPFGDMFTKVLSGDAVSADAVAEACTAMNTANGK
jgi:arabinogalactan oligomer/maltooligosaccharide transport system substrate-binding protein